MQREIKFRQPIRSKDGKFIEWFYWGIFISPAIQQNGLDTRKESQQFTGMKDINGIDIFEGDIVIFKTQSGNQKEVVRYDGIILCPFLDQHYVGDEQGDWIDEEFGFEIIGNIYENENLIK